MALSCNLNKNLLKANTCAYSLPTVTDLYIANFGDVSAHTDYDCASGVTVSAITVADNGTKYRTHTLTFGISGKYDKDMVCPVDALSLGRFWAVVKTADKEYLALGGATGLEASAQSIAGGGDNNGITVTLAANVTESAVPLSEAAVTELLSKVAS